MKKQIVFILLYNNSVQYASKDVKCLVGALQLLCQKINVDSGLSYVQITRIINEKHSYFHAPVIGHCWEIIERELLYTRRKKRLPVQVAPVVNTNVNKSMLIEHKQITNPNTL